MSASYSYARTVLDVPTLLYYVAKTFPTISSITNEGGVNVVLTFTAALTSPQQTTLTTLLAAYVDPIIGRTDALNISVYNNTTSTLAAAGTYTGIWEDVSRYSSVIISALSNVASATSGMVIQFGIASAQADILRTFTLAAASVGNYTIAVPGRWMRVVYTNGATLQTSFSLQVRWSVFALHTIATGADTVDDTTAAQLVRGVNMARLDIGTYTAVKADEDKRMRVRVGLDSSLSDLQQQQPLVQTSFLYSINSESVITTLVGSGTATYAAGYAQLSTAASATSSATVASRRVVAAAVGRPVRAIVSCAFGAGTANNTQLAGVGSLTDGLFIGYNGIAFGVNLRSSSTDVWTAATAFNVDKLNGTGSSGITLDPTKGNVYQITYDSTGFGQVTFSLCSATTTESVVFHRLTLGNAGTIPYMRASLPMYASVLNSTNATVVSMRVSSMSAYSSATGVTRIPRLRAVDYNRTVSSMTYVPILSVQNKTTYQSTTNTSTVALKTLSIAGNGTKGNILISLYDTATLTNASYTDLSTNTSPVQVDTAATTVSGGVCLFSTCINCAGERVVDLAPYDIQVMAGATITVVARCSASNTSNEVAASLCWSEYE